MTVGLLAGVMLLGMLLLALGAWLERRQRDANQDRTNDESAGRTRTRE